jgi:hypothetical protein
MKLLKFLILAIFFNLFMNDLPEHLNKNCVPVEIGDPSLNESK